MKVSRNTIRAIHPRAFLPGPGRMERSRVGGWSSRKKHMRTLQTTHTPVPGTRFPKTPTIPRAAVIPLLIRPLRLEKATRSPTEQNAKAHSQASGSNLVKTPWTAQTMRAVKAARETDR